MIVWELYAKTMDENAESPIDLVEFVGTMAKDLGQVDAVCEYDTWVSSDTDPAYVDAELPRDQYAKLTWGENYPRLQRVKAKYDPSNLFRYPQSVQPARYVCSTLSSSCQFSISYGGALLRDNLYCCILYQSQQEKEADPG